MKAQITAAPLRSRWNYVSLHRRGGAGQGVTGTKTEDQTVLDGPPDSTITADRSNPNIPEIGGSVGGFIGLIGGVFIIIVILLLAGFYLFNRRRRRNYMDRTPRPGKNSFLNQAPFPRFRKNMKPGIPALQIDTFETDPYSDSMLPGHISDTGVGVSKSRGSRSQSEDMITPKNEQFAWNPFRDDDTRPGYIRQRSEEWEIPNETQLPSRSERSGSGSGSASGSRSGSEYAYGGYGYGNGRRQQQQRQGSYSDSENHSQSSRGNSNGKGKGKEKEWIEVELPSQPHTSAIPLRSRSPRPSFGSTVKSEGGSYREVLANKGKRNEMIDNPFADTASLAFEEIGRLTPEPESGSERSTPGGSRLDLSIKDGEGRESIDTVRN